MKGFCWSDSYRDGSESLNSPLRKTLWQFSLWLPSHPGPLLVDGDIFFLNFWRFEIRQDGTIPWELRVTYVGFNIPTYCPVSININK